MTIIDWSNALEAPAVPPWSVRTVKRTLDIVSALIALSLLSPILILVGFLVKATSKGPILIRQERVGKSSPSEERFFRMLKFRSMRHDAEKATGPVWAGKSDSRITPLGKWLRRSRVDELPQFWNVLRGEMSLVGPRPERPFFTSKLSEEIPAYNDRVRAMRPGITGWAQVNCEYDSTLESVRRKLSHDVAYAAHLYGLGSYLRMEAAILLLTVGVVLTGKGAR